MWIALSFDVINMNTVSKSFLASDLASPAYIERIQTVKNLADSDVPFLTSSYFRVYSDALSSEEYSKLSKRMIVCTDTFVHCLPNFLSNPRHSLTAFVTQFEYFSSVLKNRAYHRLDKFVKIRYSTMITPKDSFLNRKITTMMLRIARAGLSSFWTDTKLRNHRTCDLPDFRGLLLQKKDAKMSTSANDHANPVHFLTLASLYFPFLFLGLGLLLAGAVFILELSLKLSSYLFPMGITFYFDRC